MQLAICDYGIGGLGLYKKLREVATVDVLYFSDTGYTPYGKVPEQELRARVNQVVDYLFEQGVSHVAVACNSASSVLTDRPNVTGIIQHGVDAVVSGRPERVGIVGGRRTIVSQIFRDAIEDYGIEVHQQVAQELSIRIEAGDVASQELARAIGNIFGPLQSNESILLACTHYPVIRSQILQQFPHFELIDPIDGMLESLLSRLKNIEGTSKVRWLTTGSTEKMQLAAQNAFGLNLNRIEQIAL